MLINFSIVFAKESTDQNVTVMSPGSGDHPWQVWYLDDMTADKQASQVAVGFITRGPSYNSPPPMSPNDIQVELVCVQAPQRPPSGAPLGPPSGPPKGHG